MNRAFLDVSVRFDGAKSIGITKMQTVAKNNLFLTDISSKDYLELKNSGRFYQEIAKNLIKELSARPLALADVAQGLISAARHAYSVRQIGATRRAAELLSSLPLPKPYERAAKYLSGLCCLHENRVVDALTLFADVSAPGPPAFRARAVGCMGVAMERAGDLESALRLYFEAARAASTEDLADPLAFCIAQRNIAIGYSRNGDHIGALAILERLEPVVRTVGRRRPHEYYNYLNSLAIELGEVGRATEAQRICGVTLSSGYAHAYPEWRETADEIALKIPTRSSTVAIPKASSPGTNNLFRISIDRNISSSSQEAPRQLPDQQARVLSFTNWKTQMSREPLVKPKPRVAVGHMTRKQKIIRIVDLVCNEISEEQLDSILEAVERIAPDEKVKD